MIVSSSMLYACLIILVIEKLLFGKLKWYKPQQMSYHHDFKVSSEKMKPVIQIVSTNPKSYFSVYQNNHNIVQM